MSDAKDLQEDQTNASARRAGGEFVRGISRFRHQIGETAFPPEKGRYHLFVALNCPRSHRVTLAVHVLGLAGHITMDVAFPNRTGEDDPAGPGFWEFAPERKASLTGARLPEFTSETGTGRNLRLARDIYALESSTEKSVPILYDKAAHRIVNNWKAWLRQARFCIAAKAISAGPGMVSSRLAPSSQCLTPKPTRIRSLLNARLSHRSASALQDQETVAICPGPHHSSRLRSTFRFQHQSRWLRHRLS